MFIKFKKIGRKLFRNAVGLLILSAFVLTSFTPVFADESSGTVGPQGPIGPQGTIGPQGPTGVQGQTGPQQATDPQEVSPQPTSTTTIDSNDTPSAQNVSNPEATNDLTNNNNTGPNSENQNNDFTETNTELSTENNSTINNNVDINLNTGNNEINNNTVIGNTSTGNIDGAVNLMNISNSQFALGSSVGSQLIDGTNNNQVVLIPSANRTLLENTNTGPSSENLNTINNPNVIKVFDQNDTTINNGIEILANTGKNTLSSNTNAGDLSTGDINLGVNLINMANILMPNTLLSMDIWTVLGPLNGNIIIPELNNVITGANSNNQNTITSSNKLSVDVTQNADLSNTFDINTNTGNNKIGENTVIGDVSTGDSSVKTALTNVVNFVEAPIIYLINVFGKWSGSLLGLDPSKVIVNQINSTTGSFSENKNKINTDNSTNLSVQSNAALKNQININANTGENTIGNSTVVGNIETGDIGITANVINFINSFSDKAGQFVIRLVNIFGDWNGDATSNQTNTEENNMTNSSSQSFSFIKKPINKIILSPVEIKSNELDIMTNSENLTINKTESVLKDTLFKSDKFQTNKNSNKIDGSNNNNKSLLQNKNNDYKNPFPWKTILFTSLLSFIVLWIVIELSTLRYKKTTGH